MVFLLNNKDLIKIKKHPVFKYETGMDSLIFIIPPKYGDIDVSALDCVCEVELPSPSDDDKFQYAIVGYDTEPYKEGYLSITVPITTAITKYVGEVKVWLMLIEPTDETRDYAKYVLKTNSDSFNVLDNGSSDSGTVTTFDEIWKHVSLDALVDSMNNLITYDRSEEDDENSGEGGTS